MADCIPYFCIAVTKIPDRNKGGTGLLRVQAMVSWLHLLGQNIMAAERVAEAGSRERKGIQEGAWAGHTPKDMPSVIYFLQQCPPAFHHRDS
jgi:hypothetical protein